PGLVRSHRVWIVARWKRCEQIRKSANHGVHIREWPAVRGGFCTEPANIDWWRTHPECSRRYDWDIGREPHSRTGNMGDDLCRPDQHCLHRATPTQVGDATQLSSRSRYPTAVFFVSPGMASYFAVLMAHE